MQPTYISVGKLFGDQVRHTVPLFQRPYVWAREEQWEPLWEDISGLLDRIERRADGASVAGHFLGTVVLEQTPNATGSLPRREVIDGQQRLTTLQLVLKAAEHALSHALEGADESQRKPINVAHRQISPLTTNPGWSTEDEQYKVWPTNEDRAPFMSVMDSAASDAWTKPASRMAEAYAYFRAMFQTYLSGQDIGQRAQRFAAALKDHLRLIVLDLDTEDEPQAIFETLNAHGTPLLPADLIKNWLLWEANRQHLNIAPLYESHWKQFDRDHGYWRARVGVGHAARARIDTFLQNWLSKETLEQVSPKHLYDRFLRYMTVLKKQSPGEVINVAHLMSGINSDSVRYQRITEATGTTRFDAFLRRLAVLDVIVFQPLLLAIMGRAGITSADLDNVAIVMESYLVRRMICGMQTRGAGSLALSLLRVVDQVPEGKPVAEAVEEHLLNATGSDQWPNDTMFRQEWMTRRFYNGLRRDRVSMVLQALEEAYQKSTSSKAEPLLTFDFSQLEIEHVMPQKWQEHWPLIDGQTADGRDIIVHRVGNLTLVSKKLNPALSNAPWVSAASGRSKREGLEEHSKLELNKRLLKQNATWDEASISQRAGDLFEQAIILWPIREKRDIETPVITSASSLQSSAAAAVFTAENATSRPAGEHAVETGSSFQVTLQLTYFNMGFFNVSVDAQHLFPAQGGIVKIICGPEHYQVDGRFDRSTNTNGTPRIFGYTPLKNWFQRNLTPMEKFLVEVIGPSTIILNKV
ncbi:DUF262 domain-containing protein [Burkholderia sp. Ac-20349]|uniref:DUF262 domain-containing protein n=1 Tax=Burkholderia sp. Ac-20349 TaxID=2703893 RepID=UPI00197C7E22|nr:DUF262 domain-containing protein [Burkholderia sp. Ac-20349]MBN3844473.1 DUF262 domain-containing protein [Burkholderia sp. Ac-20349]